MRVLLWEHFCSGAEELRPEFDSIRAEGLGMLTALADDLVRVPSEVAVLWNTSSGDCPLRGVEVWCAHPTDFAEVLARAASRADRCLGIAPEFDSGLVRQARIASGAGSVWCGANIESMHLCGDKLATFQTLTRAGVPTVPTCPLKERDAARGWQYPWIAKPRFGAGCENTLVLRNANELRSLETQSHADNLILQPYLVGRSASVVVLAGADWPIFPPVEQDVRGHARLSYHGGRLVIPSPFEQDLRHLTEQTLAAMSLTQGWVGVDVVFGSQGPVVVDVNPRLTTSFVAYRAACGTNLGARMLGLCDERPAWRPGRYTFDKQGRCDVDRRPA